MRLRGHFVFSVGTALFCSLGGCQASPDPLFSYGDEFTLKKRYLVESVSVGGSVDGSPVPDETLSFWAGEFEDGRDGIAAFGDDACYGILVGGAFRLTGRNLEQPLSITCEAPASCPVDVRRLDAPADGDGGAPGSTVRAEMTTSREPNGGVRIHLVVHSSSGDESIIELTAPLDREGRIVER